MLRASEAAMSRLLILIVSCGGLVACLPQLPAARAATVAAPVIDQAAATSEDAAPDNYVYSPVGKREPFLAAASVQAPPPPTGPGLQRYDLDQLKLALTTTGSATPSALIVDPKGKAHTVQLGDLVGKFWGKVTRITHDDLEVTESLPTSNGGIFLRVATLHMGPSGQPQEGADVELAVHSAR
jgi:Tfp pilus assembly protein PilP